MATVLRARQVGQEGKRESAAGDVDRVEIAGEIGLELDVVAKAVVVDRVAVAVGARGRVRDVVDHRGAAGAIVGALAVAAADGKRPSRCDGDRDLRLAAIADARQVEVIAVGRGGHARQIAGGVDLVGQVPQRLLIGGRDLRRPDCR